MLMLRNALEDPLRFQPFEPTPLWCVAVEAVESKTPPCTDCNGRAACGQKKTDLGKWTRLSQMHRFQVIEEIQLGPPQ